MIDLSLIKENYARMSDEQLISLANNEGDELTSESLNLLHEEFLKRNLNTDVFGVVEDNKTAKHIEKIERIKESAADEFEKSVWAYALNEKWANSSNAEIKKGLLEMGLEDENADMVVRSISIKAKEILDACDTQMIAQGAIALLGLVVTFVTYMNAVNGGGGVYIVAWGAIIFGTIRCIKSALRKGKYKTILSNIRIEESGLK